MCEVCSITASGVLYCNMVSRNRGRWPHSQMTYWPLFPTYLFGVYVGTREVQACFHQKKERLAVMADQAAEGATEGSWEMQDNLGVRPKKEGTGNQGEEWHAEEKYVSKISQGAQIPGGERTEEGSYWRSLGLLIYLVSRLSTPSLTLENKSKWNPCMWCVIINLDLSSNLMD